MNIRTFLWSPVLASLFYAIACGPATATATLTQRPTAPPQPEVAEVEVSLAGRSESLERELVSFGLPLPPDYLADASMVRVIDERGQEIAAAVKALEPWRIDGQEGTIRSVLIQFTLDFSSSAARTVTAQLNTPRQKNVDTFVPVAETLLDPEGLEGPRVLAVLPSRWLCDSWVVGPQIPAFESGRYADYDRFADRQFGGSLQYINSRSFNSWLFDRTSSWYKMYVRTGQRKFLEAAYEAAHFVRIHTAMEGRNAGHFTLKRQVDLKYVYPRAMHIHYLLTGDERALEAGRVMAEFCLNNWDPEYRPPQLQPAPGERLRRTFWTERHTGYGLLGVVHGWEMTGEKRYWDRMKTYADALYRHQQEPPDGRPKDGSFRRVWGSTAEAFRGASSPWMTAILIDPLFHYWMLTGDERIPRMVVDWCDFLDRYGITPGGETAYYVINSPYSDPGARPSVGGNYMELHNIEMCYMFAMGAYMTTDPARVARYRARYERLWSVARRSNMNSTPRAFNWAFQASSQLVYFWQQVDERVVAGR